jgi:hypothetical protein
VLVARDGKVLVNRSYGIPVHPKYTPTTTIPNFPLGEIATTIRALASQLPAGDSAARSYPQLVTRRLFAPLGINKSTVSAAGEVASNVDELYRWELGLEWPRAFARDSAGGAATSPGAALDVTAGWQADKMRGLSRLSAFGTTDGRRNAFLRFPDQRAAIIILTSSDDVRAKELAERIADRLLGAR